MTIVRPVLVFVIAVGVAFTITVIVVAMTIVIEVIVSVVALMELALPPFVIVVPISVPVIIHKKLRIRQGLRVRIERGPPTEENVNRNANPVRIAFKLFIPRETSFRSLSPLT
jgi:hypothetical protein